MGESKALLPWEQRPLVLFQVEQLHEAGCDPVIVVTGFEHERVAQALAGAGATIAYNERFAEGRAGSVRVGVAALPSQLDMLVVLNVDQPRSAAVTRRLIAAQQIGDVGSSRVDLQACKLEYSIVSPK